MFCFPLTQKETRAVELYAVVSHACPSRELGRRRHISANRQIGVDTPPKCPEVEFGIVGV